MCRAPFSSIPTGGCAKAIGRWNTHVMEAGKGAPILVTVAAQIGDVWTVTKIQKK
jgi:hypothetical protein